MDELLEYLNNDSSALGGSVPSPIPAAAATPTRAVRYAPSEGDTEQRGTPGDEGASSDDTAVLLDGGSSASPDVLVGNVLTQSMLGRGAVSRTPSVASVPYTSSLPRGPLRSGGGGGAGLSAARTRSGGLSLSREPIDIRKNPTGGLEEVFASRIELNLEGPQTVTTAAPGVRANGGHVRDLHAVSVALEAAGPPPPGMGNGLAPTPAAAAAAGGTPAGAPAADGNASATSSDPLVRELLSELRDAARQLRTRAPAQQAGVLSSQTQQDVARDAQVQLLAKAPKPQTTAAGGDGTHRSGTKGDGKQRRRRRSHATDDDDDSDADTLSSTATSGSTDEGTGGRGKVPRAAPQAHATAAVASMRVGQKSGARLKLSQGGVGKGPMGHAPAATTTPTTRELDRRRSSGAGTTAAAAPIVARRDHTFGTADGGWAPEDDDYADADEAGGLAASTSGGDAAASSARPKTTRPVRTINPSAEYTEIWGEGGSVMAGGPAGGAGGGDRGGLYDYSYTYNQSPPPPPPPQQLTHPVPAAALPSCGGCADLRARLRVVERELALEREQHRQIMSLVASLIPRLDLPSLRAEDDVKALLEASAREAAAAERGRRSPSPTRAHPQPRRVTQPPAPERVSPPRARVAMANKNLAAGDPHATTPAVGGAGDRLSASMERSMLAESPRRQAGYSGGEADAPAPPPSLRLSNTRGGGGGAGDGKPHRFVHHHIPTTTTTSTTASAIRTATSAVGPVLQAAPPQASSRPRSISPNALPPRAPRAAAAGDGADGGKGRDSESPNVSPKRPRRPVRATLTPVYGGGGPSSKPGTPAGDELLPPAGLSAFSSITPRSANSSQLEADFGIRSTLSQLKNLVGMA